MYVPEIPPKKAIGNKDTKFVEDRRLLLEQFLVGLTRHKYLWQSEEFTTWVRSSNKVDIFTDLKIKTKKQIKNDELGDRAERYALILSKLEKQPEFNSQEYDTGVLNKEIEKAALFANINLNYLKQMTLQFKSLMD
jgi:hypothetical protein